MTDKFETVKATITSAEGAGRRFRCKDRGLTITMIGHGVAECSPSGLLEGEHVVLYRDDDGAYYARRRAEFWDGRFEEIAPAEAGEPTPEQLEPFARKWCEANGIDPDAPKAPHGEWPEWYDACGPFAAMWRDIAARLRAAASATGGKPTAWLHTVHMELNQTMTRLTDSPENPWGKPGRDYSAEYEVTSEPLYKGAALPVDPVPVTIFCPRCRAPHIDEGEWATTRRHKTHQCQGCGYEWRPFPFPTVGVRPPNPEAKHLRVVLKRTRDTLSSVAAGLGLARDGPLHLSAQIRAIDESLKETSHVEET